MRDVSYILQVERSTSDKWPVGRYLWWCEIDPVEAMYGTPQPGWEPTRRPEDATRFPTEKEAREAWRAQTLTNGKQTISIAVRTLIVEVV